MWFKFTNGSQPTAKRLVKMSQTSVKMHCKVYSFHLLKLPFLLYSRVPFMFNRISHYTSQTFPDSPIKAKKQHGGNRKEEDQSRAGSLKDVTHFIIAPPTLVLPRQFWQVFPRTAAVQMASCWPSLSYSGKQLSPAL